MRANSSFLWKIENIDGVGKKILRKRRKNIYNSMDNVMRVKDRNGWEKKRVRRSTC